MPVIMENVAEGIQPLDSVGVDETYRILEDWKNDFRNIDWRRVKGIGYDDYGELNIIEGKVGQNFDLYGWISAHGGPRLNAGTAVDWMESNRDFIGSNTQVDAWEDLDKETNRETEGILGEDSEGNGSLGDSEDSLGEDLGDSLGEMGDGFEELQARLNSSIEEPEEEPERDKQGIPVAKEIIEGEHEPAKELNDTPQMMEEPIPTTPVVAPEFESTGDDEEGTTFLGIDDDQEGAHKVALRQVREFFCQTLNMRFDVFPDRKATFIGRSAKGSDVVIQGNKNISRVHAAVSVRDGQLFVRDMSSSNGTFVNGQRLTPNVETPVNVGDQVTFADTVFVVEQ